MAEYDHTKEIEYLKPYCSISSSTEELTGLTALWLVSMLREDNSKSFKEIKEEAISRINEPSYHSSYPKEMEISCIAELYEWVEALVASDEPFIDNDRSQDDVQDASMADEEAYHKAMEILQEFDAPEAFNPEYDVTLGEYRSYMEQKLDELDAILAKSEIQDYDSETAENTRDALKIYSYAVSEMYNYSIRDGIICHPAVQGQKNIKKLGLNNKKNVIAVASLAKRHNIMDIKKFRWIKDGALSTEIIKGMEKFFRTKKLHTQDIHHVIDAMKDEVKRIGKNVMSGKQHGLK